MLKSLFSSFYHVVIQVIDISVESFSASAVALILLTVANEIFATLTNQGQSTGVRMYIVIGGESETPVLSRIGQCDSSSKVISEDTAPPNLVEEPDDKTTDKMAVIKRKSDNQGNLNNDYGELNISRQILGSLLEQYVDNFSQSSEFGFIYTR